MCDDIERTVAQLRERGAEVDPVEDQRWGRLSAVHVPGLGKLGVYEPRHPRP
jgi:hypothetical protein